VKILSVINDFNFDPVIKNLLTKIITTKFLPIFVSETQNPQKIVHGVELKTRNPKYLNPF